MLAKIKQNLSYVESLMAAKKEEQVEAVLCQNIFLSEFDSTKNLTNSVSDNFFESIQKGGILTTIILTEKNIFSD